MVRRSGPRWREGSGSGDSQRPARPTSNRGGGSSTPPSRPGRIATRLAAPLSRGPPPWKRTVLLSVLALAVLVVLLRVASRQNQAGIHTSRAGRVLTLVRMSLATVWNRVRRLAGGLFLSRASREARDRAIESRPRARWRRPWAT